MAQRPEQLVAVVGTGTEVGKTWVTCATLRKLREQGVAVAARKPAQSYAPGDTAQSYAPGDTAQSYAPGGRATDAHLLGAASGESPERVCPPHRWYGVAYAPPMAADALGRSPFTVADLVAELTWPPGIGVGFVETAGGVRSPIASDGDCADFVRRLAPDLVVLVADAGLGTINAVRLCVAALAPLDPVVLLNRFDAGDDLHQRNLAWLRDADRFRVTNTLDGIL